MTRANLAVVRIRGIAGVRHDVSKTMEMLHLYRNHFCTVIPNTPSNLGMLQKAKDHISWGTISDETLKMLFEKRGIPYKGDPDRKQEFMIFGNKKYKKFFRLSPPRGGFEKKGIKTGFGHGGALGDRKDMNSLLERMI